MVEDPPANRVTNGSTDDWASVVGVVGRCWWN